MFTQDSNKQAARRHIGRGLKLRLFEFAVACVLAALITTPSAAASPKTTKPVTVRVDASRGAPRLVVNGKPVRARMFFGLPGAAPVKCESPGRTLEFEFTADNDSRGKGTLHFRFGQKPGDVFLDNIRVVDVGSGKDVTVSDFESGPDSFSRAWTFYPSGEVNTVGTANVEPSIGADGTAGVHVNLRAPAKGQWPDWHILHLPNLHIVRGNRYRVTFWARAEPARDLTVAFYRPGDPYVSLGGPPGLLESQIEMAASAGVDFVSFCAPMPWPAPGEPADWSATDAACEQVLGANPNALLLPRISADPPPAWWRKAHPDDVMTWEDGSQQPYAVVASPTYRRDAAARVAALVEHLESKYGNNMAGYHPCGQNTGEWFYQSTWGNLLNGYAPADTAAWRVWLRKRYRDDAALQKAWRDPAATLNNASVPTAAQRRATPTGTLHDPATQKALIDFAEFQQDAMADLVCELAHATRKASRGRKLVVFFYGYLFEFATVRLGPATSGHYALRRVLDCPDIDMLCSPIAYFDRGIGGSAPMMSATESVALAGKMWLSEDDTRTHLTSGPDAAMYEGAKNLAESQNILLRNVAQEATRNCATWWMDLGATGWFNEPRLWDEMRRLEPVDRIFLKHRFPYRPEVAAVIDERSMLETSASIWTVTETGISAVRQPLARLGTPYGQYLLDDVVRGRVRSKLYVFLNAWQLSAEQRKALCKNTRNACNLWCYAPGLHDGDRTSPEAMRELTGFQLAPVSPEKAFAKPTNVGKQLGLLTPIGVDKAIMPLFAAADATPAETLATYSDGSPAIALRRTARGWSMFVGVPGLTSDLLRIAARKGGVHLYTQTDCNVYANGPIIALHGAQDGPLALDTSHRGEIRDALTGDVVGNGPNITLPMTKGETRVLRLDKN